MKILVMATLVFEVPEKMKVVTYSAYSGGAEGLKVILAIMLASLLLLYD